MVQIKSPFSTVSNLMNNVHWTVKYLVPILLGAIAGNLLLMPINELMIYRVYEMDNYTSFFSYMQNLYPAIVKGERIYRFIYYSTIGSLIGLGTITLYQAFWKRRLQVFMAYEEANRNIQYFINLGESEFVEFKSSFRYDVRQDKVNRGLEQVIMKTLAGFMNSEGGTLLIGVDDDGKILGLEDDYSTLKKQNSDGYEQLIMTTIANNLGTAACKLVELNFHTVDKKEVCRLNISASQKPVYVKSDKASKFYIRTGSGTREMSLDEAVEYIGTKFNK